MKTFYIALTFLFLTPMLFAHGSDEIREPIGYESVFPAYYIEVGNYSGAIFISLIWIGILKGIYELSILVIGRAL